MSNKFPVLTRETAPSPSLPAIELAIATFGFVPNLIGVMAASPALAESYLALSAIFETKTSLTSVERQVVLLTVSRYHECRYCVAAHSMAAEMQQVPPEIVGAIRNDQPIPNSKLQALRSMVICLIEQRGWLPEQELQAFLAEGYSPEQLFEVLVGVAQKTLSNFTNHIAETPLDEPMSEYAWSPVDAG